MKKIFFLSVLATGVLTVQAQYFNEETKRLYQAAVDNNDSLQLFNIKKEQAGIDIQSARYNFLPKINFGATYTHLNDEIVFPQNLQTLLNGTQKLLIKEAKGVPFHTPLPAGVPLQPVPPIQKQDFLKTTVQGQWLLFSGLKVSNGVKALQHQQKAIDHLAEKQRTKLWLDVSEAYDKLALAHESDAILRSSEEVLQQQIKFVNAAIANGLATPLDRKKVELAQQRLEIKKLENKTAKKLLAQKLQQLTGLPLEQVATLQPRLVPALFDPATPQAERPEIRALNESLEARRYKEKAELAEYVPKLAAFGQYELRRKDLSILEPQWAVGLKLQWNLFDGLAARNNARKERLERQSLTVQKKAAGDQLALAYNKTKQDYELATDKVALKSKEVALAEDSYAFVAKQFSNGLTTITEVLNALADRERARFEQTQALYEQRRAALQAADWSGTLLQHL